MYDEQEFDDIDGAGPEVLRVDIHAALKQLRPDRYERGNKEWMEDLIREVSQDLVSDPPEVLAYREARRKVFAVERYHAKTLNEFLGSIGRRPPLWTSLDDLQREFSEFNRLPLAVGDNRVRFGRAEPQDLEQWAHDTEKEEDERRSMKREEERGAQFVADALRRFGLGYPEAVA